MQAKAPLGTVAVFWHLQWHWARGQVPRPGEVIAGTHVGARCCQRGAGCPPAALPGLSLPLPSAAVAPPPSLPDTFHLPAGEAQPYTGHCQRWAPLLRSHPHPPLLPWVSCAGCSERWSWLLPCRGHLLWSMMFSKTLGSVVVCTNKTAFWRWHAARFPH